MKTIKEYIWIAYYNAMTWESAPAPISIHKTKEGALKALEVHREIERIKHEYYIKTLKEIDSEVTEEMIGNFDDHKSWFVREEELKK